MSRVTLQSAAFEEAHRCLGIVEQGGNNSGREVLQLIRDNGGTGPEAWCGDFVAHCYKVARAKVGKPRRGTRLWAAVRNLGHVLGTRFVKLPRRGDILTFNFDHTGIVDTFCDVHGNPVVTRKATHVRTIEGNTGSAGAVNDSHDGHDGVKQKVRHRSLVAHWVRVDF